VGDLKESIVETYGKEFEIKGKEAIRVRDLEAILRERETKE
jgi:hypothetical protein